MKQNWTMYIYKTDKRYKTGERLVSTTVWRDRDAESIQRECQEVSGTGFKAVAVPTTKTVKNLMTGELVEIPHDTPRSCDPSSELYWSM
jgi:hypothetical protein